MAAEPVVPALPAAKAVAVQRWRDGQRVPAVDAVAVEAAVALTYHGIPQVVMMASPLELEDLAAGFTLTEGYVESPAEIVGIEASVAEGSCRVEVTITAERFAALLRRQRNLTGRTGCGTCGAQTVDQVIRPLPPVASALQVDANDLHRALAALPAHQVVNRQTGSVHAAAWVVPDHGIELVREDVGRHNALDKVLGALIRTGRNPGDGYLLLSSRASYEMVQKAAVAGVGLVAAISAPTALAIDLAAATGVTLVGFAREGRHVVYTHGDRLA